MKPKHFLMALLLASVVTPAVPGQTATVNPGAFSHSTQMIVVTTDDWNEVAGRLERYERDSPRGKWRPVGVPIAVAVGKKGMGWGIGVTPMDGTGVRDASDPVKREGDGKSPAGIFALGTAFGYAPQALPGLKLPYLQLTESTECVDDMHSKNYNRILERPTVTPDWSSSEHMRDVGEAYRWGVVIDHNGTALGASAPVPGGGSCVFLHIWAGAGHGTAGCTAMRQSNLETLLTWIDPKRKPLLVEMPEPKYRRLISRWKLLPQLP
jgi:L,D-peptidoglycan transpeptidase YkuD (ErfK/YbiS/YcfS/YnhG family)